MNNEKSLLGRMLSNLIGYKIKVNGKIMVIVGALEAVNYGEKTTPPLVIHALDSEGRIHVYSVFDDTIEIISGRDNRIIEVMSMLSISNKDG